MYRSIDLTISIYLAIVYLPIYLSINQYAYLPIDLPTYLPTYLSIYLSSSPRINTNTLFVLVWRWRGRLLPRDGEESCCTLHSL